jgi:peptidyl-dipeptidase Dcp
MKPLILSAVVASLLLAAGAFAAPQAPMTPPADSPFAQPSALDYRVPPFDRIGAADFAPAFAQGMAAQRAEVDAIVREPSPPSFDNTILALEKSGQMLDRVGRVFFALTASNTSEALDKIEAETAPKLAAHQDAIFLDGALYGRVKDLHERRAGLGLDAESLRLLERYHTQFVRAARAGP